MPDLEIRQLYTATAFRPISRQQGAEINDLYPVSGDAFPENCPIEDAVG